MIRVPAHVTGFFKPVLTNSYETSGSLGAGFSLKKYVYTDVKSTKKGEIKIFFGDRDVTEEACTSYTAAKILLDRFSIDKGVEVYHRFDVPIGCGLATSGAGALGVAFGINEVFGLGLSNVELAKVAHVSEVICRTGLGSVIAQYLGMFEVRIKAGAPGIGKVLRFPIKRDVVLIVFGPIETKKVLSSSEKLELVKNAFGNKHVDLANNFSVEYFSKLSKEFAEKSNLLTSKLKRLLFLAEKIGLYGSMLMLGDGIFLFGEDLESSVNKLLKNFRDFGKPKYVIFSEIDNEGVKIV